MLKLKIQRVKIKICYKFHYAQSTPVRRGVLLFKKVLLGYKKNSADQQLLGTAADEVREVRYLVAKVGSDLCVKLA